MIFPLQVVQFFGLRGAPEPTDIIGSQSLTRQETAAASCYQKDATALNTDLRKNGSSCNIVSALDSAFTKSWVATPFKVYRGGSLQFLNGELRPGAVLHDNGFLSTSRDSQVAKRFAKFRSSDSKPDDGIASSAYEIAIHLPTNQAAIDLSWVVANWFYNEKEILLPRATALKLIQVSEHKAPQTSATATSLINMEATVAPVWTRNR